MFDFSQRIDLHSRRFRARTWSHSGVLNLGVAIEEARGWSRNLSSFRYLS